MHGSGWYNSASGPEHVITGGIKIEFEWKKGEGITVQEVCSRIDSAPGDWCGLESFVG